MNDLPLSESPTPPGTIDLHDVRFDIPSPYVTKFFATFNPDCPCEECDAERDHQFNVAFDAYAEEKFSREVLSTPSQLDALDEMMAPYQADVSSFLDHEGWAA